MRKFVLNNGMSVVFAGNARKCSVCLSVNVGHVNEPMLGIANLFEHTLLLQCSGIIPVFGGTMTAFTASGDDFEQVIKKVAKIFSETIVSEEYLEKAKAVIVKQIRDIAPLTMRRMKLDYKHYAFGADLVKTTQEYVDAINSYSVDDVRNFANTYYTAKNVVLVVAGVKDNQANLKELVATYFGNIESGEALPRMKNNIYTGGAGCLDTNDNMTRLMFGWDLHDLSVYDGPVCNVLMSMFLRRLERAYAEAGYPDVSVELKVAGYYGLRTMRALVMSQSVDAKTLTDIFVKAVNRICDTYADDYRMERSRNAAMVEKLNKYDSSDDCALEVAWQMIGRGQMYGVADRISSIAETTAGDVKDLARRIFRGSRLTYIVAQTKEKEAYSYADVMRAIGLEDLLKDNEL